MQGLEWTFINGIYLFLSAVPETVCFLYLSILDTIKSKLPLREQEESYSVIAIQTLLQSSWMSLYQTSSGDS